VKYAETTTSDADILALRWLPVDLDAKRPAGISSTDGEHEAAITKAREIRRWLIEEQHWPAGAFVLADSGNGSHLNVKIDLPNLPENVTVIRSCLETLDFLFSDEVVQVDTTSQNPARIWKLYGTTARKGDSTAERPHRLARLLEVPEAMEKVARERLEALAAMLPRREEQPKTSGKSFDPVAYCQAHNLQVHHTKPWTDRDGAKCTVAVLEQCVFNPDHHRTAVIIGWPSGMRSYRCRHNSCLGKHWADAKEIVEPSSATKEEKQNGEEAGKEEQHQEDHVEITEEDLKTLPKTFNPRLEVRLEARNFITKYMAYAKTTSDAYEEYHFASGLVLLSVAADRQIVISMRHGDIYPNIWIFPIGDSTVSRKTTAHKLCKLILKSKYPRRSLPSSFSPEALMDAISATPRCFYLKDEAGSLLSSLCKDYMAETRDFLAEIYECDDYYRKLKKSECQITAPYITQYLMTTPDNLKEYTTPLDLTSGWLLRYLWMYPNYPKEWKSFAEKDSGDFDAYATIYGEYNLLVEKLANPRRLSMTSESMQFFQEWQKDIEETAMQNADNITKALAGRLMTHAVKMAALFTIGREDFDENSKIELPHIQEATRLVVEYFLPIGKIIVEEVARAESKNVQDKIIGTLKRYNGLIKQRDLLRVLHMKIKDVEESINALILSEEIEKILVKTNKGANVLYYKLLECISESVSHDEVYKGNNEGSLYTPPCDAKTLKQMGQYQGEKEVHPGNIEADLSTLATKATSHIVANDGNDKSDAVEEQGEDVDEGGKKAAPPPGTKSLKIIYIPKGPAGEYAGLAFNPWIGCRHGCKYQHYKDQEACYAPGQFHKSVTQFRNPELKKDMLRKLDHDLSLITSDVPLRAMCGEEWVDVSSSQRSGPIFMMFSGDFYSAPLPSQHTDCDSDTDSIPLPRKILELFNKYKVPFDVLTKAGTAAVQDFNLYFA
jgi:hypothetical protein